MNNFFASIASFVSFCILNTSVLAASLNTESIPVVKEESVLEKAFRETKAHLSLFKGDKVPCFPKIQGNAEAHIIYSYGLGAKKVDPNLNNHAPRGIDVIVEKTKKPALLVLSAYEPIVWKIKVKPGAQIAGVYLTGYYEQMIVGLPEKTSVGRVMKRLRDGSGKEVCSIEMFVKTSAKSVVVKREISKQEYRAFLKILKKMDNDIRDIDLSLQTLNRLHKKMLESKVEKQGLSITTVFITDLKSKISKLTAEQTILQKRFGFAGETRSAIKQKISRMRSQRRRGRGKKHYFSDVHMLENAEAVNAFEKKLNALTSFKLASYQTHNPRENPPVFTVSAKQSKAFLDIKLAGKARLAALSMPDLPLIEKGSAVMSAPAGYINRDGLKYLVGKGYLEKEGKALAYYQKKCAALAMFRSGRVRKRKCYIQSSVYTLLGPITFPKGLCGGNSVAFLRPKGVPKPKGKGCHSVVIDLEDEPCLGSANECYRGRTHLGFSFR